MSAMLPCPFCGGGETRIEENRLRRAPTMDGKESPIVSVEIRHWCPPQHGQPSRNHIVKVGRDMDAAIAAWNRRATPAAPARGCICPPGSEATCKGLTCPRRAIDGRAVA